jgi:alpha-aminoadipic semialdehyde synthase
MENLPSEKTYMFFSHVIKGQTHNMQLLQSCLEKRVQLIDYEFILDSASDSSKSKRSIAFGKFAGYAGMVDTFPVLGRRLLMKNSWSTPFLHCPPTIHHYDLVEVKQSITKLAEHITTDGLPVDMPPLVFAMTGKGGCVYGGVREIFDILPHETVSVEELPEIMHQKGPQFQVYVVAPEKHEIYQHEINGDSAFDRSDYMTNPHLYKSVFAHKVAPYVSVVINAAYWDYRFPRILTKDEIKRLYAKGNDR